MSDATLRDLLARGYEGHASSLKSGDAFAARYHDHVASRVRRRRAVRHTAIAAATVASVTLVAVGAQAAIRVFDLGSANPVGPNPSSIPGLSPTPEVPPETSAPTRVDGAYVPPLPVGEAPGSVTENDLLRLIVDAQAPTTPGLPSDAVSCGTPIAGTYVDPIFDQASARILKPDTLYPTFLDPAYATEAGDVLLGLWSFGGSEVDRSYLAPAGEFLVAVSYLSEAIDDSWLVDDVTGTFSGGVEVSYDLVTNQGVFTDENETLASTDTIDLAYGAVLVRDGAIIGHTDFLAALGDGSATMTINEVSATDGTTEIAYDFGSGPLEHVLWCGDRPTGQIDAYAVIGVRPFAQEGFVYSFIWAGRVEYL